MLEGLYPELSHAIHTIDSSPMIGQGGGRETKDTEKKKTNHRFI